MYIYVVHRIRRPLKHTFRHQNQLPMAIFDKVIAEKRFLRISLAAILNLSIEKNAQGWQSGIKQFWVL